MEIIFLDDASTDSSVDTAQIILSKSGVLYKIIVNKRNSGSVFAQWQQGLEQATGKYIWFAEADDACHRSMLLRLVMLLETHMDVGLAYCQSAILDAAGRIQDQKFYPRIHAFIDEIKWKSAYVNNGIDEIRTALAVMNTIPNASAVLMRKETLLDAGGIVQDYVVSGDWATYTRVLARSNIAFLPYALNYNRIHPNRVTAHQYQTGVAFSEALNIFSDLQKRFDIPDESKKKFVCRYLDQMFLNGYAPVHGEDVISPLMEVIPGELVYAAITEHISNLARFKRQAESSFFYRVKNLNIEKVLKHVIPRSKI
jgi:glycosyltransferase involved in cell wall biosynthesis